MELRCIISNLIEGKEKHPYTGSLKTNKSNIYIYCLGLQTHIKPQRKIRMTNTEKSSSWLLGRGWKESEGQGGTHQQLTSKVSENFLN